MGTWGVSPIGSDSAMDFLDLLAELPEGDRRTRVVDVLTIADQRPEAIMREIVPEEVLAAAAVVAGALPGGEALPWAGDDALAGAGLAAGSAAGLGAVAVRAVRAAVSHGGGWWEASWVSEEDRVAARESLDGLVQVLERNRN